MTTGLVSFISRDPVYSLYSSFQPTTTEVDFVHVFRRQQQKVSLGPGRNSWPDFRNSLGVFKSSLTSPRPHYHQFYLTCQRPVLRHLKSFAISMQVVITLLLLSVPLLEATAIGQVKVLPKNSIHYSSASNRSRSKSSCPSTKCNSNWVATGWSKRDTGAGPSSLLDVLPPLPRHISPFPNHLRGC